MRIEGSSWNYQVLKPRSFEPSKIYLGTHSFGFLLCSGNSWSFVPMPLMNKHTQRSEEWLKSKHSFSLTPTCHTTGKLRTRMKHPTRIHPFERYQRLRLLRQF